MASFAIGLQSESLPRCAAGVINWKQPTTPMLRIAPGKLIPVVSGHDVSVLDWELKVVTINLQSGLDKLHYIEQQLVREQVHVAFLQEVKGREGTIKSRAFLRFDSESEGVWGCAVWVSRLLPLASDGGERFFVTDSDVAIEEAGPRWLVLKLKTPASWMYFASFHRPSQTRPWEERQSFDDQLARTLERIKQWPCICGIDANARVPLCHEGVTGEVRCGEADDAGSCLASILANADFWLPSTFAACHHGSSETWTHPTGKRSRIDFLIVSRHFDVELVRTWAATEIDLLNINDDHDAVGGCIRLRQHTGGQVPPLMNRRRQYDPRELRRPEVIMQVEQWVDAFGLARLPWELDVNTHTQIVQETLVAILGHVAPPQARGPLSTYITREAWELRERRQQHKKRTQGRRSSIWSILVQGAFSQWKGRDTEDPDGVLKLNKAAMLYEVSAAAVKTATLKLKSMIRQAKNDKLSDIAKRVGRVAPDAIFRKLKEMGLGTRQPKRWKSALPRLKDPNGGQVVGRLALDAVWQQHFGAMEMGTCVPTEDYVNKTASVDFQSVDFEPDADLLPCLQEVEDVCRTTKVGKAAGLDMIPGELLKGSPGRMASLLHPIFVKSILRGRQPMQWRGGLLVEALKKAGMEAHLSGHRSLFVGSVMGKAYHRFVRTRIMAGTERELRDTHLGARRGATVTQASHLAVLFETACAARKYSSAVLFVDAKSAYYCVIRQLVYGNRQSSDDAILQRILHHFQLPASAWQELLETIAEGGLLKRYGFSDHACHVVKDLHDASFFVTRHSTGQTVMETALGSRPGESIADVIFAWVLHKVLNGIEESLQKESCLEMVPASDERDLWEKAGGGEVPILGPVWADDGAFVASHIEASALWRKAQHMSCSVLSAFFNAGLTPNLEKGKTELMITFRGRGSKCAQHEVFGRGDRTMRLHLEHWGQMELRLVTEYVHLGCVLDRGATMKFEALRRINRAQGAFQEHRRRIYQNASIPLAVRGVLFAAMVDATMFNLEVWARPCGPAWHKLQAGHARLLKRLLVKEVPGDSLLSLRLPDLVALTEHPPLEIMIRQKRLRYLITMVRGAPDALWALLHVEEVWQQQCVEDIEWLRQHDVQEWPRICEATWPEWWQRLLGNAGAFRRALSRAARSATAEFALQGVFERVRDGMCRDAYRECPLAFRGDHCQVWVCGPCKKVFHKKAHLACHFFKAHGRKAESCFYLSGAICTSCGKDYATEDRLQRHLWHNKECWNVVQQQGAKTTSVNPGIGSKEWKQWRRERPILHPPILADVFVVPSQGTETVGETPGESLVRQCTWAVGEWLTDDSNHGTFSSFASGCVDVLMRFPLYPDEMKEVLRTTLADLLLCLDEELLPWSITQGVRYREWLNVCLSCISGGWLCEWAGISAEFDSGPYKLREAGVRMILEERRRRQSTCDTHLHVGSASDKAERTHGLDEPVDTCISWHDVELLSASAGRTSLTVHYAFPGEAKAGGLKSSFALSFQEADGVFTFARALLEFEQPLRRVWRAFLRGACVELHFWGSKDGDAVYRGLELFSAYGWRCNVEAVRGVCLCSDGPAPSPCSRVSLAN